MTSPVDESTPYLLPAANLLGGVVDGARAIVSRRPSDVELSIDFSSGTPMGLSLHARTASLPDVTFTRESSLDRATKAIGLSREVQLGDPSFDPHVWVGADLPDDAVRRLLRSPDARRAIVAILHTEHLQSNVIPAVSVRFAEQGVFASVGLSTLTDEVSLRRTVDALATLAATVAPDEHTRVVPRAPRARVKIAFVIAAALSCLGVPSCVVAEQHPPLFEHTAPFVLGLGGGFVLWLIVVVPVLMLTVRGRSSSGTTLLLAALAFQIAIEVNAVNVLLLANWALDDSPIEAHRAIVVAVTPRNGDDGPFVEVVFESWRDPEQTASITHGEAGSLRPGSELPVRTKRGYFGWDWLVDD